MWEKRQGLSLALFTLVMATVSDLAHCAGRRITTETDYNLPRYWGLSYSPAWSHIGNFTIGANDGSTAARYPYLQEAGTFLDSNFNWKVQDPRIKFDDSKLWAIEASMGYKKNLVRIEVEVDFKKFNTKATSLGDKRKVTETTHLLAKELAHGVVSGNTEQLGLALAETSPHDIVAFAQAVGRTSQDIDSKVCNKKVAVDDEVPAELGLQDRPRSIAPVVQVWSCVDYVDVHTSNGIGAKPRYATRPSSDGFSLRFGSSAAAYEQQEDGAGVCRNALTPLGGGSAVIGDCGTGGHGINKVSGAGNERGWVHSEWWENKKTNRGWPGTAEGKINTAQGMAGDLVGKLTDDEKATVAGILTRVVSGAEVVEIRAISTASVMLNACYDFRRDKLDFLYPFGCVGVGTNLISVSNGHLAAKLAYKLKLGLDYLINHRMTAYVNGYYHQVLGSDEYYDIPLMHLVNDRSAEGKNKNYAPAAGRSKNFALAAFKMSYTGLEAGIRFAF